MASVSLSQTLRSFVRGVPEAQRRCFIVLYPNPLFWIGLRNGYSNQTSYIAAFGRGHDDTLMSGKKAWAINYSANYSYFQAHQDQLEFSKWVNIFDNGRTCSKSSKNLRETLIEVVEEFAHYDLGSRSGMESAAWDLESRICAVSSGFKEAKEITGSKVGLA
ncbi:hypothetical protein Moror_13075 [Moniliophthora roreri MCA 2997]|uniref:Uncharacterized protein n=1 Tax=Moniliophthora roreri (strain MCA 2997) TaxID=1381753 RepID=V2XMU3_MONRO|nr:hypothetical protein Moror_13075 [Moniliophthora roreri MCA 2997]